MADPTLTDLLSDEHKEHPALKDFSDINALAKGFIDTKAMVGNMIRIPGEDASSDDIQAFKTRLLDSKLGVMPTPDFTDPEATAAYYRQMGTPEKPEEYTPVEGLPEDRFAAMTKLAHEAGISDKQFTSVMSQMILNDTGVATNLTEARDAGIGTLKTEWGEAYAQKFARAQRLAEATKAPQALLDAISDGKIDAASLKWLDGIAANLGGEGANLTDQLGAVSEDTKDELKNKRDELTRKLQSERLPQAEHERLVAKLVDYNTRILAGTG